jgi:hypothetical protein
MRVLKTRNESGPGRGVSKLRVNRSRQSRAFATGSRTVMSVEVPVTAYTMHSVGAIATT